MQVKADTRSPAYASATVGEVISRAKETHTPNRVIRLGAEWDQLADAAGKHKRASVIKQLVQWYLRYTGVKLPDRPPHHSTD